MGVSFADDTVPGVDLIMPDAGFIIDKKDDLLGVVLTHAHEDHIGAVAHIWPELKCKLYATPFTAALITEKFKEKKIDISPYLKIVPLNSKIKLGEFEIDFVTLTHSILNGARSKIPFNSTILRKGVISIFFSLNFSEIKIAVKGVAKILHFNLGQMCTIAPI